MKKNLIALAVASAIAAPVAMADAPVVYGQLNLNIANLDNAGTTVNSTASRLGIKGSEDLGNGLKAVYKVEFGVDGVADGSSTLSNRNQYLGLAGGFGTVLMGRHDTPLKMSQPSDLFPDGAADLDNKNMNSGIDLADDRAEDVLAYVSPSFSGVKLVAAAVMGEDTESVANSGDFDTDNDALSAAIMYGSTKQGLYLAAAMTDNFQSENDDTRFSAQYKTGGLTVNGMYHDAKEVGTVTAFQAGYKIGKFMPKVKVSMADPEATGEKSTTNMAIGLNYSLGKKTTAYIYAVDADKNNDDGSDSSYIGMVHKF